MTHPEFAFEHSVFDNTTRGHRAQSQTDHHNSMEEVWNEDSVALECFRYC